MNAVEILALIFAIAVILKMAVILISRKSFGKFAKSIYSKPALLFVIELVLGVIVFYYLLQTLSIVTIMACVLLGALLTGMSFAFFTKELSPMISKIMKANVLKKIWFLMLIWLALAIWVLIALF
ncbi:MAG: hypothetical protein KJ949_00040 [Nanoarchaeota archaeon]|nr:hypothetical protein [Nanoarchaeota archaeon]